MRHCFVVSVYSVTIIYIIKVLIYTSCFMLCLFLRRSKTLKSWENREILTFFIPRLFKLLWALIIDEMGPRKLYLAIWYELWVLAVTHGGMPFIIWHMWQTGDRKVQNSIWFNYLNEPFCDNSTFYTRTVSLCHYVSWQPQQMSLYSR